MNEKLINTLSIKNALPVIICSTFLFMSTHIYAHNNHASAPLNDVKNVDNLNQKIALIRQIYSDINNNIAGYKSLEIDNSGQSTEGGFFKFYTHNNELKKVEEAYYGETGKRVYEYYFKDNSLYFILEQTTYYNAPINNYDPYGELGADALDMNKSTIYDDRYYFYKGKMIKWLDRNNKSVPIDSEDFINKQQQLLEQSFFN